MGTPVSKRILPFMDVMGAVLRSFWYFRNTLSFFCILLVLSSLVICLLENSIKNYWEALYITALSVVGLGYNNYTPSTILGRILILFDSFLGLVFLGLVVWTVQYCFTNVRLRVSKYVFMSTKETAKTD